MSNVQLQQILKHQIDASIGITQKSLKRYSVINLVFISISLFFILSGIILAIASVFLGQGGLAKLVGFLPPTDPAAMGRNWKIITGIIAFLETLAIFIEIIANKLSIRENITYFHMLKINLLGLKKEITAENVNQIEIEYLTLIEQNPELGENL